MQSMGPTPILPPIRAVPFVFEANAAAAASRRLPVRPGVGTNPGEENLIRGISIMQSWYHLGHFFGEIEKYGSRQQSTLL